MLYYATTCQFCVRFTSPSQLLQDLISTESEFLKEMEFVTSNHLKRVGEESTSPHITSHKETIFRNIDDLKIFHNR